MHDPNPRFPAPERIPAFARRPAEWRALFAHQDALRTPESGGRTSNLSKGDRKMIVTATSAANSCLCASDFLKSFFQLIT